MPTNFTISKAAMIGHNILYYLLQSCVMADMALNFFCDRNNLFPLPDRSSITRLRASTVFLEQKL